uniref:Putative movement protein n=1 Tax=Dichorhavirus orchidaceae TaxID=152177 RepID=A0A515MP48_9RHAB|nr:putative movement protein [Dichorhavirus orchidaceae]
MHLNKTSIYVTHDYYSSHNHNLHLHNCYHHFAGAKMSTLPVSTLHRSNTRDEVRETAGRRMAHGSDSNVTDFNRTLQTAEAWQKRLIHKTSIKVTGVEGEGRITMVRKPILFDIMNGLNSILPTSTKPTWIMGMAIKWVPTCDLSTTGSIKVSIQNKAVNNPVLRDHTVVSMTQRVTTPFEVQYTSSSKLANRTGTRGNPWMYTYCIEGMDDAPVDMEVGDIVVMPMIKSDDTSTQWYEGVKCNVYGGHFPLNIPVVTYCAPGPRFKTNMHEIRSNIDMLRRYLNVQGFTDIDEELVFKMIQCCDGEAAGAIMKGIRSNVWAPMNKTEKDYVIIKEMLHDCRVGRVLCYITLGEIEGLSTMGGDKSHSYR